MDALLGSLRLGSLTSLARAVDAEAGARDGLVAAFGADLAGAVVFADACAARLADGDRGAHHTPWAVARWVAARVAAALAESGSAPGVEGRRVLDPACGAGHLLLAAHAEGVGAHRPEGWLGWDVDEESVAATRLALWLAGGGAGRVADYAGVRRWDPVVAAEAAEDVTDVADVVVANPPFVSVRGLARTRGAEYLDALRRANPALRGSFDLYVPFLLRLGRWLAPHGHFALIVPTTLWTAGYARAARLALAPHVEAVHHLVPEGLFPGRAVHTDVLVGGPCDDEGWAVVGEAAIDEPARPTGRRVPRRALADGLPGPDVAPSIPLGRLAEVHGGTPGYHAAALAGLLREAGPEDGPDLRPLVVTRSVGAYVLEAGPVRFLRRRWERPVVDLAALTPGKRALFGAPKVLVGGISRSLVAALDTSGVALGVNVFAVVPRGLSAECVLALLNAAVVGEWYRERFRGRRLSGGFFAVNCEALREVPVPRRWLEDVTRRRAIEAAVRERLDAPPGARALALDAAIGAMVREDLAPCGMDATQEARNDRDPRSKPRE